MKMLYSSRNTAFYVQRALACLIFAKSAKSRNFSTVFRLGESSQDPWLDSPSLKTVDKWRDFALFAKIKHARARCTKNAVFLEEYSIFILDINFIFYICVL